MIQFIPIRRLDHEVLSLFKCVHRNFGNNNTKKQLSGIIKNCSGHFYKVYYSSEFIGCAFFDTWNHENKTVNFGGFSKRGTHQKNIITINTICDSYKDYYGYTITANTKYKAARICLSRAGFKKTEGNYIYG